MSDEYNEFEQEDYLANEDAYHIVERYPRRALPFKAIVVVVGIYFLFQFLSSGSLSVHTVVNQKGVTKATVPRQPIETTPQKPSLHQAVSSGNLQILTNLLQQARDEEINQVIDGMTPIMLAATKGSVEMIDLLYTQGADPNKRGSLERTALQYASEKNHIEAAKRLLSYGADIDAYDNGRLTPLIMAANRGHTELGLLFIEKGADLDIQHAQGWTALIDATIRNNQRLVRALLAAGADRNIKMENGMTAYDYAVQYKHKEMIRLLRK